MDAMLPQPAKDGGLDSILVASLEMSPAVMPSRVDTNSATGFLQQRTDVQWTEKPRR